MSSLLGVWRGSPLFMHTYSQGTIGTIRAPYKSYSLKKLLAFMRQNSGLFQVV